jgi:hypothetical protein
MGGIHFSHPLAMEPPLWDSINSAPCGINSKALDDYRMFYHNVFCKCLHEQVSRDAKKSLDVVGC